MLGDRMPWLILAGLFLAIALWIQPTAAAPAAACVMKQVDGQPVGEVYLNGKLALRIRVPAGSYGVQERCSQVADRLNQLAAEKGITDPRPYVSGDHVVVKDGDDVLVTIAKEAAKVNRTTRTYLAWQWANNLRKALDLELLDEDAIPKTKSTFQRLTASWYGQAFAGRRTASGELFVPEALTAAHRTLPFNTKLRVINPETGAQAIVRVNDRGPWVGGRDLDLSWGAASRLGLVSRGVAQVMVEVMELGDG